MSHIAVLCHQKLPDGKEDGNSDDTDQCLCRFHMLYHHLSRRRKHQDLNHRLCRMLTEHLDKLNSDYQRQCICKKLCKKDRTRRIASLAKKVQELLSITPHDSNPENFLQTILRDYQYYALEEI